MAKNKNQNKNHNKTNNSVSGDKPTTLKDLLRPGILDKLKERSASMIAEEDKLREAARQEAEETRKAEQKALEYVWENDFGQLLENSKLDWKKYK